MGAPGTAWLVAQPQQMLHVSRGLTPPQKVSMAPQHRSPLERRQLQRPATGSPSLPGGSATAAAVGAVAAAASRRRRWQGRVWAGGAAVAGALRRLAGHRLRVPAKRAQSPVAEIAFGCALFGSVRALIWNWKGAANSFQLRDDLLQEMAVAKTYENSVTPWIQTGVIALVASVLMVVGVKAFIKSMKDWENRQEMKEMNQMGEDAVFLMSTPVDATPLEKKKKLSRKKGNVIFRIVSTIFDWLFLLRLGACVGYLLPLLNVLDFGEISVSLYPYPLGVPPSEPIVNFMMGTMKLRFLYNAYLKSGYYFLIVWFLFIQLTVRNKAAPFYLRFHSSQAILISMLLGVPQQVFFAVLNPWEAGLLVQTFMYHSMVTLFLFVLVLVMWCCFRAMCKKTMQMPLVSEAAVMWAGRE